MTYCYDDGTLRSYLDMAMPMGERREMAAHLLGCAECRVRLEEQRVIADYIAVLVPTPQVVPDPEAAFARFQAAQGFSHAQTAAEQSFDLVRLRRTTMGSKLRFWSGSRRTFFAGVATLVVLVGLLAFPPVRAAADQLLNVFRLRRIVFVPTSTEQLQRLQGLKLDDKSLFVATPHIVNTPAAPRTVDTLDAASEAAGFAFKAPTVFPSTPTETSLTVRDHSIYEFTVDVDSARQLLAAMDVKDVTLPDAFGAAPIRADMASAIEARYRGKNYEFTLTEGRIPTVALPDGVDMRQLGKAALRVLGMDPQQAETLSQQIDWNSTLLFPFPTDMTDVEIRQVTIGGAEGLMMQSTREGQTLWNVYWQQGDQFYVLQGHGRVGDFSLLAAAESIK